MSDLKDAIEGLGPVAGATIGAGVGGRTPGRILREARETRRLSLEDVAQHLKYAPRQIEALERDDYMLLPAATVVRGMVRSYAKFLELPAEPLIQSLNEQLTPAPAVPGARPAKEVPFLPARTGRGQRAYWMLSALVAVLVIAFALDWRVVRENVSSTIESWWPGASIATPSASSPPTPASAPGSGVPIAVAPSSAESSMSGPVAGAASGSAGVAPPASGSITQPATSGGASAAAPSAAPVAAERRIEMRFARDSWVEIRAADNRLIHNQLNLSGTTRSVDVGTASGPLRVVVGAASGVTMSFDGKPVDLAPFTQVDVARLTLQ